MQIPVVLKSKLTIPKLGNDILSRQLMTELKSKISDYSVCVVTASAGFGKTTLLSQVVQDLNLPVCWYTPGPEDDSVYIFLAYLVSALEMLIPGISEWYFERIGEQKFAWQRAFEILLSGIEELDNSEGILVIDDWQLVERDQEVVEFFDRFLCCKPEGLRVVLISREVIKLPMINRLRVEERLLEVNSDELAFSKNEIEELINNTSPNEPLKEKINDIYAYTEGWIMAIKLVLNSKIQSALVPHSTFSSLFEYLSYAIIEQLGEETRQFLINTSIPEFFGYQLCNEVLGYPPEIMDKVIQNGLFISEVNNGLYRYHNLFRDFLYGQARKNITAYRDINNKLAQFYLERQEYENSLGSFIKAENWAEASEVLNYLARDMVYSGRGHVLRNMVKQLPQQYQEHSQILLAWGDEERFACAYNKAIGYYRRAEDGFRKANDLLGVSKALRGIGEIYLETLEPKAAQFLFQAYRVLDEGSSSEKAAILSLLAENKINLGKPQQAARYRRLAEQHQKQEDNKNNLEARMLLRSGRVNEAIRTLESIKQISPAQDLPKIHSTFREAPMLLSSCYSFVGEAAKAVQKSREVINMGQCAGLPIFEGLGNIRLGHALLTENYRQFAEASQAYEKAEKLLHTKAVIRVHSELNMGKCLLYALQGSWDKAEETGLVGLSIARESQDEWFTSLLLHVLGMGAALCSQWEKANNYLKDAQGSFEACGDSLGKCVVYWWLSYVAYAENNLPKMSANYDRFLDLVNTYEYYFLVERPTLFGDITGDKIALVQQAYHDKRILPTSKVLVDDGAETNAEIIEDYRIKIYSLGKFQFIREGQEIPLKEWRRKNALRLFTIFLVKRRTLLNKEDIIAYLWPEDDQEFAERNFKSALYNLNKVLEPNRKAWAPSYFIQRSGSTYYFNLAANFWFDVDDFLVSIEKAKKIWRDDTEQAEALINHALNIYQGDFFEGVNMDEWCLEERERLIIQYIKASELLARFKMKKGQYEEVLKVADLILEKDKYWERAYQSKIWCYKKMNNMVMATRTFNQCVQRFKEEMGITPSPETVKIYQQPI